MTPTLPLKPIAFTERFRRQRAAHSAAAAGRRLRISHLFVWTGAVACCLAVLDGLNRLILRQPSDGSTATLAVAMATAFCALPWYVARRRASPGFVASAGESLWLLTAGFAAIAFWARWKLALAENVIGWQLPGGTPRETRGLWLVAPYLMGGPPVVGFGALVCVAGRLMCANHAWAWRVAFGSLRLSALLGAIAFVVDFLGFTGLPPAVPLSVFIISDVVGAATIALAAPMIGFAAVRDVASPIRYGYRWSHWTGVVAFLAMAALESHRLLDVKWRLVIDPY